MSEIWTGDARSFLMEAREVLKATRAFRVAGQLGPLTPDHFAAKDFVREAMFTPNAEGASRDIARMAFATAAILDRAAQQTEVGCMRFVAEQNCRMLADTARLLAPKDSRLFAAINRRFPLP